jgi:hypothetical protein
VRPGSRRAISEAISPITSSFERLRLAKTRFSWGKTGARGAEGLGPSAKRLSTTSLGVRTHASRVKTAATVAILFLFAFSPFLRRTTFSAGSGLRIGMPVAR